MTLWIECHPGYSRYIYYLLELIGFDDWLDMGLGERNEGVKNDSKDFVLSN